MKQVKGFKQSQALTSPSYDKANAEDRRKIKLWEAGYFSFKVERGKGMSIRVSFAHYEVKG